MLSLSGKRSSIDRPDTWCLGGEPSCRGCVWDPGRSEQTSPGSEKKPQWSLFSLWKPFFPLSEELTSTFFTSQRQFKLGLVRTSSSLKGTPLCMLIFFRRSPPSQNSITMKRLPFSTQRKEGGAHVNCCSRRRCCNGRAAHSPRKDEMKETMFGCLILDSSVTSFLDDSLSFADIWVTNTPGYSVDVYIHVHLTADMRVFWYCRCASCLYLSFFSLLKV